MNKDVTLTCTCGALCAKLLNVGPQHGTHIVCHCDDCRAANNHLGLDDPGAEGVDLYQTSPSNLKILKGGENLGVMKLRQAGILRWYAKCCNTPMYNTMKSPKLPFVGVVTSTMEDGADIGPVKTRGFVKNNGKTTHPGMRHMMAGMISRMARERISGRWKDTPFFDASSMEPVVEPIVLDKAERDAAYSGL
ncbi:DUF6151 family protein [Nereida sp. MMG025]|uniref:DUF6151 family protein n=1 Tax=Nereida sp. MMG025 TaxID=2909981 RepID=UPI001F3FADC5|nr:DUF6151 family protein [Nereida sp. MMG025]MCF6443851.1 DUF6151 family protein [Nereida sp. MMG025]